MLSGVQAEVAERVVAEESRLREHVVVYLSGAHAYGFPSHDSDVDLKAIHVAKTEELLGLDPVRMTFDRAGVDDGVEIDYTSNELGAALHGLLTGNGNYLERVLGPTALVGSVLLAELRPLALASLNLQCHRHYRGFAASQLRELENTRSVKRALYVLRTALTGMHLLLEARMVVDVRELLEPYGFAEARELVARKRDGEKIELGAREYEKWRRRLGAVLERLDDARTRSRLPERAPNRDEVARWLIDVRRRRL